MISPELIDAATRALLAGGIVSGALGGLGTALVMGWAARSDVDRGSSGNGAAALALLASVGLTVVWGVALLVGAVVDLGMLAAAGFPLEALCAAVALGTLGLLAALAIAAARLLRARLTRAERWERAVTPKDPRR